MRKFLLLALLALNGFAAEAALPQPTRAVIYKKIGDTELKLHVFESVNKTPGKTYPAIVFFFGGGWKGGSPEQFYRQCAYFAGRGMIAMSAEYRTENKTKTSPRECVMDGKSCLRWIRSHATELQIDLLRFAAGGGSAGGHVAAASIMLNDYDEPGEDTATRSWAEALVLFNPVLDNGPEGYGYERVSEYYQQFSPAHNLKPGLPPTLLMLGTKDKLIPVTTLEKFKTESEKLGNRCDLILYPDQAHGFFNYKQSEPAHYEKTVQAADDFLVSLGFIPAKTRRSIKPRRRELDSPNAPS